MLATVASLGLEFGINALARLESLGKIEINRVFSSAAGLIIIVSGLIVCLLIQ